MFGAGSNNRYLLREPVMLAVMWRANTNPVTALDELNTKRKAM